MDNTLNPSATEVAVFRPENVQMVVTSAPQAYDICDKSHTGCLAAGRNLLDAISAAGGLTPELDQQAAHYIEKARRTVKKMNDARSPITKLFDQFRSAFTAMEADCDPAKRGSVPYQLQVMRNEYAARQRAEAERIRQEESLRQQRESSMRQYRADCDADYLASFNRQLNATLNGLQTLAAGITLDTFDAVLKGINGVTVELAGFNPPSSVRLPASLTPDELGAIRQASLRENMPLFAERYANEVSATRDELLLTLPSKRAELERIAKASAEEAARLQAEMKAREAEEAARAEQARQQREAEEAAAKRVADSQAALDASFAQAEIQAAGAQPKVSVKLRVEPLTPQGYAAVFSLWWEEEGCRLSLEELAKCFKKQVTFVERLANNKDNPRTISHPAVRYVEETKAL
jgi:hypothetical protein